ncbi:MAG TPA: DUF222 domain-containing protein [Marmoricola sp.]|nr:DUF222 domain-containing protein [Marmoricola sp.]
MEEQTTTTGGRGEEHSLLGFVRALDVALDEVADGPDPVFLRPAAKTRVLVEVCRQVERLDALRHRLLGVAEDAAEAEAARSVAALLAHHTRRDVRRTGPQAELATALEQRWHVVQRAWLKGRLNGDQARVIVEALDKLPDSLSAEQVASAEEHLVALAADFDPQALRNLGSRLFEVIAPEEADALEAEALAKEEAAARAATRLDLKRCGDGSTRITGRIPDHVAHRLRTLLEAYTSPRRLSRGGGSAAAPPGQPGDAQGCPIADGRDPATGERLRAQHLRGLALCALLEHADPTGLPVHGGTATTVMVTMTLEHLLAATGSGTLDDGASLSPGQVRRLACSAGIVPAVLGSASEVLDLGRTTRLFSPAQVRALRLRDRRCRADGCQVPAAWCEAHHARPWSRGGRTDLGDGLLLCAWHHHRVHGPGYHHDRLPNGDLRFHRRT